jgi:hypothetical protein
MTTDTATQAATIDWSNPEGLEVVTRLHPEPVPVAYVCEPDNGGNTRRCYWLVSNGRELAGDVFSTKTGTAGSSVRIRPASSPPDAVKPAAEQDMCGELGETHRTALSAEIAAGRETSATS